MKWEGRRRRWGQIHYNNPRGCHGPHPSVAADRALRWTEQEKLSRKKTPEDSPRSEMCFCRHSNTQTIAATRGTRSNKAAREGSEVGVATPTLSTKEKKKWGKKKKDTWMIPRTTDINLTRAINASWQTRGEVIPVCSAVWSHWGETLSFWWTRWLRDLKYFAVDKHSAHYMHLHHAGVSHRQ